MHGDVPGENRRGFSRKGKTLLSAFDPAGKADRAVDALPVLDRTLYLCLSPLFGYGLERLLARLPPQSAVLCVEADDELFGLSLEHFNKTLQSNPRLRLIKYRDNASACAFVRHAWGPRVFRRVEIARLSGGWQLFPALYDSLAEALRRNIAVDWGNALTLTRLGRRYARNLLRNLTLLKRCPGIGRISFGDRPTLVLGAGPSLDGVLDGLFRRFGQTLAKPEQRPFAIVCVDTCLPALHDHGIAPDLAVILESQHWNLGDFTGCAGWQIPAAMDLSALPRSGTVLAGGLFLFMTPWTELRLFERMREWNILPDYLAPLGSVGLSAVEIARRLGRGPVIVAGIDFSFTLDSYHARSTPGHSSRLRSHNRFRSLLNAPVAFGPGASTVVSKSGDCVLSNPVMYNYQQLCKQEFSADPRLFDIVGSGLPLGFHTLSQEAAFDALARGCAARETISLSVQSSPPPIIEERLNVFTAGEKERLTTLRDMLNGAEEVQQKTLNALIDECDYLWAHFPDYAAAGGRRPDSREIAERSPAALSFLKRLRTEIDPFIKLWDMAMQCK